MPACCCQPDTVACQILSRGPEVDTAFVCQMTYPGGRSFTGTFGFDTGYANRLDVLGPNLAASLDRVFTPPPGAALELACNTPTRVCCASLRTLNSVLRASTLPSSVCTMNGRC